jgi:4-amino-4-deoxy-L-arabinose transferase-like glycosyltransferase
MKLDEFVTRHKTVIIVLLFFAALTPRLYKLESKNAWMDESKQAALASINPFDFTLAERASRQQQPPLDYFLQSIFIKNFGVNETGIRMHAALLGAGAAVLFFLLLLHIVRSKTAVLLGTIAFVFHPYLIRYSQEGRPISTAVFFCMLYLYYLVKFFQQARTDRPSLQSFAVLTAVQTGFLLSVGFQPVIFLLVSSISLAPHLLIKERRSRVLLVYLSSASAFLISLPIIKMTIRTGARFHFVKQNSIPDMIKNLAQGLEHINIDNILQYYRVILGNYGLFFLLVIAAGFIGFILNSKKREHAFTISYFTVFFMFYPLVYTIVFNALISWNIMPRYYLTFVPICFALMTLAVCFSLELAARSASRSRPLKYVPLFVITAIFAYSFISNTASVSRYYNMKKPEWEKLYDVFLYDSEVGDIAYLVNLVNIDGYSPDFRAKNLYYPSSKIRPVNLNRARSIPYHLKNPKLWKKQRNIYLVTRYGAGKIKKEIFTAMENIEVFLYKDISLIRIKKKPGIKEDFISALRLLKTNLPPVESNYILYELLITIDLDSGNIERAQKNIALLETMNKRKKLDKIIRWFKRRIKKLEINKIDKKR